MQRALTGGALTLLGETLGTCTSVSWPLQNEAVLCQKPAHHVGRHSAQTVFGIFDWGDPSGFRPFPEVAAGLCDPDDEHDRAKEAGEDPL